MSSSHLSQDVSYSERPESAHRNTQRFGRGRASAQQPVTISPELAKITKKANSYSELSNGAFDITFASLGRYYDYRNKLSPSEQQREALLPAINYRLIHLDAENNTLWFAHPKLYIDLGGIAKGYAVDNAIAIAQSFGVEHASITAGGDSRVIGDRRGRPWMGSFPCSG